MVGLLFYTEKTGVRFPHWVPKYALDPEWCTELPAKQTMRGFDSLQALQIRGFFWEELGLQNREGVFDSLNPRQF